MPSKSKQIGNNFEYEVRDFLRETTGIQSFERVPTSGAWIGGSNAYKAQFGREDVTEIMAGDLICPENWRWVIECKNQDDVSVHQLFIGKQCPLVDEFLQQTQAAANLTKKEPLLVMKWRRNAYKPSKGIKDKLKEAGVSPPKSRSITLGILVAERIDYCTDIVGLNHIQYTGKLNDTTSATWCFFDFNEWLAILSSRKIYLD